MGATGDRQCRAHNRRGEQCGKWAIKGALVCATHGGSIGRVRDAAEHREQERKALELARRYSIDLSEYASVSPADTLRFARGATHYLSERLVAIVAGMADDELRYPGKAGECIRGELTALQKALDGLSRMTVDVAKLGIDARESALREKQVRRVEQAVNAALEAAGLGFEQVAQARKVVSRHLRLADGEGA